MNTDSMNWRQIHKALAVLLQCCAVVTVFHSNGLSATRDEQMAKEKGPEIIASEVVVSQLKVNKAGIDTVVEQINQAIRSNKYSAGQLSIKLNPSINKDIEITMTLQGETVLTILKYLKEISGIPYIAQGKDIWIGPPVILAQALTEQELTELRNKLQKLPSEALVDLFTETKYQGLASHATAGASGFAALEIEPRFCDGVLGSEAPMVSPIMREIVKRGVAVLSVLIEHLRDDRQTLLIVGADGFHTAKWHSDEYDPRYREPNRQPQGVNTNSLENPSHPGVDYYVLKVGDICYEAIGQIVNRHLAPIRYQPTACLIINSPVETPALARAVREDWGSCTTNEHIQSLILDAHNKNSFDATMAVVRLCFYYPQTGEKVASDLLHRPLNADEPCEQADLIHSLAFFKSDIIDKAVIDLAKRAITLKLDKPQAHTTLMEACKQRLAGTTYEEEFRQLRWHTIVKEPE